jgi:hypothetical protein
MNRSVSLLLATSILLWSTAAHAKLSPPRLIQLNHNPIYGYEVNAHKAIDPNNAKQYVMTVKLIPHIMSKDTQVHPYLGLHPSRGFFPERLRDVTCTGSQTLFCQFKIPIASVQNSRLVLAISTMLKPLGGMSESVSYIPLNQIP